MSNRGGLLSNLFWKFAERISAQIVTLLVSIILARLLEPEHYGIISIVMIFISIANVFVSDSFGNSLIQKKDADALDFSSVLWFNIGISICLYVVLFFSAPIISKFYGEGYELITPVLRILGIRLIISAINSVQQAYISRKMMFKKFFLATLLGTVASAFVGIIMAYMGYGVWALVAQYLTNTIIDTVVLQITLKKKPLFKLSFSRLKGLIAFGSKILMTGLLMSGYEQIRSIIIGKMYSSADLAYYDRGKQFPSVITTNINTSIGAVLFPQMSKYQDKKERIKEITRQSIKFSSYVMCPLMIGLAAVADNLVSVVLTDKWLPCVPLMQLMCIYFMFMPLHTANMQAIKAVGRSDITLNVEITKKIIELVVLVLVMRISVTAIVVGMVLCSILFIFINSYPNKKLISYTFGEQLKDIMPALIMSFAMGVGVCFLGKVNIPNKVLLLGLQTVVGMFIYLALSHISNNSEYKYLSSLVITNVKRHLTRLD